MPLKVLIVLISSEYVLIWPRPFDRDTRVIVVVGRLRR